MMTVVSVKERRLGRRDHSRSMNFWSESVSRVAAPGPETAGAMRLNPMICRSRADGGVTSAQAIRMPQLLRRLMRISHASLSRMMRAAWRLFRCVSFISC
jgi:hypothetical protein